MKKLLLTVFEPFGGATTNASQEVAKELREATFLGAEVEILSLPVELQRSAQVAIEAVQRLQPDIIIMLGEARGRSAVTPERVAINIDDYGIPDNAGNQPLGEPIVAGGPTGYFSTLPVARIRDTLQAQSVPATISNSAGTYVCNHLFYQMMHYLETSGSNIPAGFVHIPLFSESRPNQATEWPSLSREQVVKGVRVTIQTCIDAA